MMKRLDFGATVHSVAITPDNTTMIVLYEHAEHYRRALVDLQRFEITATFDTADYLPRCAFDAASKRALYFFSAYRSAVVSEIATDETVAFLHHFGRLGGINSAVLSRDGTRALTTSGDATAVLWACNSVDHGNRSSAAKIMEIPLDALADHMTLARFSDDEKAIFLAQKHRFGIYGLDGTPGAFYRCEEPFWRSDISADWRYVYGLYEGRRLDLFALDRGGWFRKERFEKIGTVEEAARISEAAFNDASDTLAVIGSDTLNLYRLPECRRRNPEPIPFLRNNEPFKNRPTFAKDGRSLFVLYEPDLLQTVDLSGSNVLQAIRFDEAVRDFGLSPDGSWLWAVSGEGIVNVAPAEVGNA